jgi:hypothetical protein
MPKSNSERQAAHRDRTLAHLVRLRAAIRPFAAIKPSSLYPGDGSEQEEYIILLRSPYDNHLAFTGLDLALAREAYEYIPPAGATYVDKLEFFTAILLAVSVNRAANLETLETFIKDLKNAATAR